MNTVISDTFTDTNGTSLNNHKPNTGFVWRVTGGDMTIESNKVTVLGAGPTNGAVIPTNFSDYVITVDLDVPNTSNYQNTIIARYQDDSNFWILGIQRDGGTARLIVGLISAGGYAEVASQNFASNPSGTTITLTATLLGTSITVSSNTNIADTVSFTSAVTQTATYVGLSNYSGSPYVPASFDNFAVTVTPIPITTDQIWYNVENNFTSNPRQSALSEFHLSCTINGGGGIFTIVGTFTGYAPGSPTVLLVVFVDGVATLLTYSQVGQQSFNVALTAGTHTIIVRSGPSNSADTAPTVVGSFIDGYNLTNFSSKTVILPPSKIDAVVYGDSIDVGGHADNLVAQDTFTDADNTSLASHTMNKGSGWTVTGGAMTIISNQATATGAGPSNGAIFSTSLSDGVMQWDIIIPSASNYQLCGFIRYVDGSNFWLVGIQRDGGGTARLIVSKTIAGTYTELVHQNFNSDPSASTVTVTVTFVGSSITISSSSNALDTLTYSSATELVTGTSHGLSIFNGSPYVPGAHDNLSLRIYDPVTQGHIGFLRDTYSLKVGCEAWGSRALHDVGVGGTPEASQTITGLAAKILSYHSDIVIFNIGHNDYAGGGWGGTPANFGAAYKSLVTGLKNLSGVKLICRSDLVSSPDGTQSDYRAQISGAAVSTNTTFKDGSGIITSADLQDGIHPNTTGHLKLAIEERKWITYPKLFGFFA